MPARRFSPPWSIQWVTRLMPVPGKNFGSLLGTHWIDHGGEKWRAGMSLIASSNNWKLWISPWRLQIDGGRKDGPSSPSLMRDDADDTSAHYDLC